jgi:hypothetical protein
MLKLNHLIGMWNMKLEMVPLNSFNGETFYPNIVAGHDILLFSIVNNAKK